MGLLNDIATIAGAAAVLVPCYASAASIAESNRVTDPPMYKDRQSSCTATLMFKPVPKLSSVHPFVVVTGPDGKKIELRGGPSRGGGSDSAPGLISPGSGDQPTGEPFKCVATNKWGVVVTYIGPHGLLGKDAAGHEVFSPDGQVATVTATVPLGRGAQPNVCKLANCMMTILEAQGKSCKPYTLGVGALRNSNTVISMALAACGVPDPLPPTLSAPGWGDPSNVTRKTRC